MIFQWSGLPQALWVLREEGTDIMSGAFVARHLGSLSLATSKARSNEHKRNKWAIFARKWERQNGGNSHWLATPAEIALLIQHGAVTDGPVCSRRHRPAAATGPGDCREPPPLKLSNVSERAACLGYVLVACIALELCCLKQQCITLFRACLTALLLALRRAWQSCIEFARASMRTSSASRRRWLQHSLPARATTGRGLPATWQAPSSCKAHSCSRQTTPSQGPLQSLHTPALSRYSFHPRRPCGLVKYHRQQWLQLTSHARRTQLMHPQHCQLVWPSQTTWKASQAVRAMGMPGQGQHLLLPACRNIHQQKRVGPVLQQMQTLAPSCSSFQPCSSRSCLVKCLCRER